MSPIFLKSSKHELCYYFIRLTMFNSFSDKVFNSAITLSPTFFALILGQRNHFGVIFDIIISELCSKTYVSIFFTFNDKNIKHLRRKLPICIYWFSNAVNSKSVTYNATSFNLHSTICVLTKPVSCRNY